jgi:hypothetical protein
VELEHEDAAGEQPFVLGTAVVALEAEEALVPTAGRTGATTPIRLPAGSSSSTSQRSPLSSHGRPRTWPPPATARPSVGWSWSAQTHTTGPRSAAGARSVVHWPIIPGASKLPEARSTDQPKTAS